MAIRLCTVRDRAVLADHQHAPVRRHAIGDGHSGLAAVVGIFVAIRRCRVLARLATSALKIELEPSGGYLRSGDMGVVLDAD